MKRGHVAVSVVVTVAACLLVPFAGSAAGTAGRRLPAGHVHVHGHGSRPDRPGRGFAR